MSQLPVRLGIRQNLRQFSLLVLINSFVGAMVGLERTILPLIAEQDFGLASKTLALSFLVSFGTVKALSNALAGVFSEKIGRKRILVAGWLFGLPVPFLLIFGPSWNWIILANLLLGLNQGFCWSTTVIMKIDLAGPKQRGLAMGLNEFAGYLAVAIAAYVSALIAAQYGLRPLPFYLGIVFTISGLLLSLFLAKETSGHAQLEVEEAGLGRSSPAFGEIFLQTSWKNKNLFSCSQAGLASNFNDGVSWGLFPLFFAAQGLRVDKIGFLAAVYPATWGITQLLTGTLSDRLGRKWLITFGMWLQGLAIVLVALVFEWQYRVGALFLLGIGTGMAYPTLLAGVGDAADPTWRTTAVGVYRFWRDLGYALGAILAGVIADRLGMQGAILVVGFLTVLSGLIVAFRMQEKRLLPLLGKGPLQ